jgi:predicted DNA binding protein
MYEAIIGLRPPSFCPLILQGFLSRVISLKITDDGLAHLIECQQSPSTEDRYLIIKRLKKASKSRKFCVSRINRGRLIAYIVTKKCPVYEKIITSPLLVLDEYAIGEDELYIYLSFFQKTELQDFIRTVEESLGTKIRIVALGQRRRYMTVTAKQEVALRLAYMSGYFSYPKKITINELANRLHTSPSALCELLRRGMGNLLKSHLVTTSSYPNIFGYNLNRNNLTKKWRCQQKHLVEAFSGTL